MRHLTAIAAALVLVSPFANAIPVTVDATGVVTDVFAADVFGTAVGDVFTLHAEFDTSAVADAGDPFGLGAVSGLQLASLATPGASMSIDLGARHWTELSDPLFGADFGVFPNGVPHVVLLDGKFFGLNFFGIRPGITPDDDDVFVGDALSEIYFGPPGVYGGDSNPRHPPVWLGAWDLDRATVTVPEPGTFGLLLLGVAALVRRPNSRVQSR